MNRGQGFTIAGLVMENPMVLAPMAGVSDMPFRIICREHGCALVYSEMISDMALKFGNRRTMDMIEISEAERPISMQIFGCDPETMASAAEAVCEAGADIVDINMGCPASKVVAGGKGSALMKDVRHAGNLVAAVKKASTQPVTVKMRKGWDDETVNAVELARVCEAEGADAIAVHGRTRAQQYSGQADWDIIARVAEAVDIPVIGNGDVRSPEDAARIMKETGCRGVMIGRGCLGNPWIFGRSAHYIRTGEILPEPLASERIGLAIRHLLDMAEHKGEHKATVEMRKHLAWYIRGLHDATTTRDLINQAQSVEGLLGIMQTYMARLEARGH